MSSANPDKPVDSISKEENMSTATKISLEDNSGTNLTTLEDPDLFDTHKKIKTEKIPGEIQDDIIYEGDSTQEFKKEPFDYTGGSEYIEDETEFEETADGEATDFDVEDYVNPILYTDIIEDDFNDIDEDSKDTDPDFGQKKKKKKKIPISALLNAEDPTRKSKRGVKPKMLECTDDLTKIDNCEDNPNFAVVIDFIEKFGEHLGMKRIPIKELQSMLSDRENEAHTDLIKLHTNLLRKTKLPKKTLITKKTWETALILFCHTTGDLVVEGLELQKLGYTQIGLSLRLEILKNLMESQFDHNERIRMLVDDLPVEALRHEPTGTDIEGKIYWTQIDDHAEIRIYTEDYRHDTWGNVVQNRVELVSLLDKLKDEKLYKQEADKLKPFDADVQDKNAKVNAITEDEKKQEVKEIDFNRDYKCEVCKLEMEDKIALMEHYSGSHMLFKLKEKFKHLVEKGQCKLCKFEGEEDKIIWIHIGSVHEKVNIVLKENKLKPIGNISEDVNNEEANPEIATMPKFSQHIPTEEKIVIEKIQNKTEKLKHQICDSEKVNQELEDLSASVQNNQENEEELCRANYNIMEGVNIMKVNSMLNLDGMTDLEDDEVKSKNESEICTENLNNEEKKPKGKRGRKRKVDTESILNEKLKDSSTVVHGTKNEKKSNTISKQKETKDTIKDEKNESIDRPKRGRACKEIAEVLKVANAYIKNEKDKNNENKGPTETEVTSDLKAENEIDMKEENKIKKNTEKENKKNKKEENKKQRNKKEENKMISKIKEDIDCKESNDDKSLTIVKTESIVKKKRGRPAAPKKTITEQTPDSKNEESVKHKEVNSKKTQPTPSKKSLGKTQGKVGDVLISSTEAENEAQNFDSSPEKDTIEKKSKQTRINKKSQKLLETVKNQKENEEIVENQNQIDNNTKTKVQGKRKEPCNEKENLTKKKKLEDSIEPPEKVERRGRKKKIPVHPVSEEIDYSDLNSKDINQTEKKTNDEKSKQKLSKGKAKKIKDENKKVNDEIIKPKKTRKRTVKEVKNANNEVNKGSDEVKFNKQSCKKCNQRKSGKELVFSCKNCEQGWHQHCAIPPLYHEPEPEWLCPLCNHFALVKNLEQTLAEFDILMERAEERRLADLIENQSRVTDDQYDDLNDYSYSGEVVNINVQVHPPEMKDLMRPNYYESSDEDAPESDDDDWGVKRTKACTCEGDGDCMFCKRMQGCTCAGQGTCRLCMSASDKSSSKPGVSKGPPKMSTTEMFMLTGKKRQVEVGAHEHAPVDGFRYRGTARGRGLPRRMRRGGRGMDMGRGQPPSTQISHNIAKNLPKNLPPGITISSAPPDKKPSAVLALGIGRSLPPGITVTNSSGKDVSHLSPKARAPVPELNLPGISLSRAEPAAKVIDIVDLSDSDDEPEIIEQVVPQKTMSVVPYQPPRPMQARPYGVVQGGPRVPNQFRGIRRPMQQGGMMRPRMPSQQGRITVQSGQRPGFRRPGVPFQRGNMAPRRGVPMQRGSYPMQRGGSIRRPQFSGHRAMVPVQRGAYPAQRRPIQVQQRGMRPVQRFGGTGQRGFVPQRPGLPPRRPMMRRPMGGRIISGQVRPRMPMMRPQQRGIMGGQRPMMRMRGRPMPGRGGPRPVVNPQFTKQDDIVIPTLTPGYNSTPDMDIIADNEEIPNFDGQADRYY